MLSYATDRKRRHSSVSSDTTISSGVSSLTRSTSIGSGDNLKTSSSKRGEGEHPKGFVAAHILAPLRKIEVDPSSSCFLRGTSPVR